MAQQGTIIACPNCGTKNRVRPNPTGVPRCTVCHTLLPWIVDATPGSFDEELRASVPVLVDFWAPWCGPCKMIAPTIDAVAAEYSGKARVGKVNTDDNPKTATEYNISAIPALLVFKGGQVVDRFVGVVNKDKLATSLNTHIG
jgi:thioredoxin 2